MLILPQYLVVFLVRYINLVYTPLPGSFKLSVLYVYSYAYGMSTQDLAAVDESPAPANPSQDTLAASGPSPRHDITPLPQRGAQASSGAQRVTKCVVYDDEHIVIHRRHLQPGAPWLYVLDSYALFGRTHLIGTVRANPSLPDHQLPCITLPARSRGVAIFPAQGKLADGAGLSDLLAVDKLPVVTANRNTPEYGETLRKELKAAVSNSLHYWVYEHGDSSYIICNGKQIGGAMDIAEILPTIRKPLSKIYGYNYDGKGLYNFGISAADVVPKPPPAPAASTSTGGSSARRGRSKSRSRNRSVARGDESAATGGSSTSGPAAQAISAELTAHINATVAAALASLSTQAPPPGPSGSNVPPDAQGQPNYNYGSRPQYNNYRGRGRGRGGGWRPNWGYY